MKATSSLRGNKSFSSVHIENDIPWEVRSQQMNPRTILKEIRKPDKYRVVDSKIIRNGRDGNHANKEFLLLFFFNVNFMSFYDNDNS